MFDHQLLEDMYRDELLRLGWRKTKNSGYRHVGVNGPVSDGLFVKDGEYIALEVGGLPRDKYERLKSGIKSGRFSLLHVTFLGEVQFFDKSWHPEHFKTDGYVEPILDCLR